MSKDNPQHALVPRLRFPEFRDAPGWPQAPLGAALTERGQKSDGVSEVHSVSLSKGIVPQVEHMGRSFAASDTSHYNLVRPFDIVYTRSPLAIFKLGIVKQHKGENNAIVSPLYGVFEPRNQHLGLIVEAFFESPARSIRYLDPLAQKGAKNTIQLSNGRFLSGSLYLPDDEDEQRKIADCLGSLDDLIAAEGRKLAALRDHKQGLMQQLFPREGETQPRLRFPEFRNAGEWEPDVLGDVATISKGRGIAKSDVDADGVTPCIRYGELYTIYGEVIHEVRSRTNLPLDDLVLSQAGDVIIPASGETKEDIATCACVMSGGIALGSDLNIIRSPIDGRFFSYYLNGSRRRQLAKVAQGDTVAHLYPTQLSTLELSVPVEEEEQHRIADCLSALDARIAGQVAKLDALRTHKHGLMQQLFPSPEGAAT